MFIVTAKLSKNKLIGVVVAAGLLLVALILVVSSRSWQTVSAQTVDNAPSPKGVSTNEDRIDFLKAYGWEVEPEAIEFQEVLIPETFDDVFASYNNLQMGQSFDLSKYKGKRVMHYTYMVKNYPDVQENVHANLLIYKNNVIGGDISSVNIDGFMHGFQK